MLLRFLLQGTGCNGTAEDLSLRPSLRHLAESHLHVAKGWSQSGQPKVHLDTSAILQATSGQLVCRAAKTEAGIWQTHQEIKP